MLIFTLVRFQLTYFQLTCHLWALKLVYFKRCPMVDLLFLKWVVILLTNWDYLLLLQFIYFVLSPHKVCRVARGLVGPSTVANIRCVLLYRCFLHLASSVFLSMLYPVTMSHFTDCHKTNPNEVTILKYLKTLL